MTLDFSSIDLTLEPAERAKTDDGKTMNRGTDAWNKHIDVSGVVRQHRNTPCSLKGRADDRSSGKLRHEWHDQVDELVGELKISTLKAS